MLTNCEPVQIDLLFCHVNTLTRVKVYIAKHESSALFRFPSGQGKIKVSGSYLSAKTEVFLQQHTVPNAMNRQKCSHCGVSD